MRLKKFVTYFTLYRHQNVFDVAMKVGHQISKTDINICHRVTSRNLEKDEGCPFVVKFVRRQKSGLMANKKSLKDCEEIIFINDDITLLRAPLAKALGLRADVKSVAMLNEKVDIYKTDEFKITFENLFKLFEWVSDFQYPVCKTSLHFC